MNMKMIAAACVAFCSASAFAAVTPSCDVAAAAADGVTLLKKCAPEITFYSAGASAVKNAVTSTFTTDGIVFDKSKPFVTINVGKVAPETGLNSNVVAYYGYGAAALGASYAGKRVAVIYNSTNGSMAGVNQLLTGLKSGSIEGTTDQKEYVTVQLHTAAAQKAGTSMPDADVTVTTASALAPVVTLSGSRTADFKTAWGLDKQKVAHMAFSDVRPSEATPGQVAKWSPASFPSETIAMQGFGVLVNTNMYKALQARDIAAKRMASACQDNLTDASCQPNVSTVDYTALMTGKVSAAADLGLVGALTLHRRPASSGTQAATQIRFAGQANYVGKSPLTGLTPALSIAAFDMAGTEITGTAAIGAVNVVTHSGTGDLIKAIRNDVTAGNLSIGVASLDNDPTKFGTSRALQTAFWVKLDGVSPDFTGVSETSIDGKYRTALQKGYSFAFEFQTLRSAKLAGPYKAIYDAVVTQLKTPSVNLNGMAYIGSTPFTVDSVTYDFNTTYTRGSKATAGVINGGNNFMPLNRY